MQRREASERREEYREEGQKGKEGTSQKKEDTGNAERLQNTMFFQWFVGSGGRKLGSLKRRVHSHVRGEMKNCKTLWRNVI